MIQSFMKLIMNWDCVKKGCYKISSNENEIKFIYEVSECSYIGS